MPAQNAWFGTRLSLRMFFKGIRFLWVMLFVALLCLGVWTGKPPMAATAQGISLPAEMNKSFTPYTIVAGDRSLLSVTVFNPNLFPLNNVAWTDNLPAGIYLDNPVTPTTDCGGTVDALPGGTSISFRGGTVPGQVGTNPGTCTVTVYVTSIISGNLINVIPAGGLTSTGEGGTLVTNTTPASATLQVASVQPPGVNKNFNPNTVWVGQVSRLTISIINNDINNDLTAVTLTDEMPEGVRLAPIPNPGLANCGVATVTAVAGADSLTLNNASIARLTTCSVSVNVISTTQGSYSNTIPPGSVQTRQGVTNNAAANATLNVQAIGVIKNFVPANIIAGASTPLTITLRNPTSTEYTDVSLTDNLPAPFVIAAAPVPLNNCGGTLTATAGTSVIQLTAGTIPASASPPTLSTCTIVVPVTAPLNTPNTTARTNTIPAGSAGMSANIGGVTITNPTAATDTLGVQAALTKTFTPAAISAGGTATVTITLRNYQTIALNGINFTDNLPAGLVVSGTPATPQCGGVISSTASSVTLTNGTLTVGGSCSVIFQVTSAGSGTYTNTIPAESITSNQGVLYPFDVSTTLTVNASATPVTSVKSFTPAVITLGGSSRLRIDVRAPNDTPITNLNLTDPLPAGMTVSNSLVPTVSNCGSGVLAAPTGATSVILTGGNIAAGQTCRIDVYVTTSTPGSFVNSIPAGNVTYSQPRPFTPPANVTLRVTSLSMSKAFYPPTVNQNGLSRLTITLTNNALEELTSVSLTDDLATMGGTVPTSGVYIVATPNAVSTCGGTLTTTAGSRLITLTNGVIPAQVAGVPGICTISVDVQGRGAAATRTNTIPLTNLSGTLASTGRVINPVAQATAQLVIGNLRIVVNKAFNPLTVFDGSASVMSIGLRNPDNAPLTGVSFTDTMPEGMMIANPPALNTGTCGGTLTGTVGSNVINFSGGALPAGATCTITLNATMTVNGNLTNTIPIGAVTTFNGVSNAAAAAASLTNLPGASVAKFFTPSTIPIGAGNYSLLTITIRNTSTFPLTGLGLIDNLPEGLHISEAITPVNNCGGTLTAAANTPLIQLAGGTLAGNATCTLEVPVGGPLSGTFTNTIPVGSLINNEGTTNTEPASDVLTLINPALNVTKTLTYTGPLTLGSTLTYDIAVENIGDVPLTGVTVTDAGVGAVLGACSLAQPAALNPGQVMTCTASHVILQTDLDAGSYVNTATADSDQTLPDSDSEVVTLPQSPALGLTKTQTTAGPFGLGSTLTYNLVATNTGNITLTDVTVTDPGPGVTLETCSPAQPASLAPGDALTCEASYVVTQADVDDGSFTNTATADSNETDPPVTGSSTVTIAQNPALTISKTVSSTGPYGLGSDISYTIVATNTGTVTLHDVIITDPLAVMETCAPDQPAVLAPGESMTCQAFYNVGQEDVDAGSFTNTATAESALTPPIDDSETVSIVQSPALSLEKTLTSTGPFVLGGALDYSLVATNTGTVTLTNVTVTDPDAVVGDCMPAQPATLAPGEAITCPATYELTQADMDAGAFTNTASAGSSETPSVSDSETVTIEQNPSLAITKTLTSAGPHALGSTLTYAIVVTNTGSVTLTNVTVTDHGAVIGTCAPAQPALLAPGAALTCAASHGITQADVDAGQYANTATADSDQTSPASDTETVTLSQNASIELIKSGTLDVGADGTASVGDRITYAFTVTNTGSVTLTNITLADPLITIEGGPIASLAPGASNSTEFTGSYTLTQQDIDHGSFTNTATASGSGAGSTVSGTDDDVQTLAPEPLLGLAKRVVGTPVSVSPGVWDVTFEILARNYGNVTLSGLQITENLREAFPAPAAFSVRSLTSSDFTINPGFNGTSNLNLLDGSDVMEVGASGRLTLVARVTPTTSGPYNNSVTGSGQTPGLQPVEDESQDGANPDPDGDGDPTNNESPTPVGFAGSLFDPPFGIKEVSDQGSSLLKWTMVWINNTNIVAINVQAYDGIPAGTVFYNNGVPSGFSLPTGAPAGSTANGVTCTTASTVTTTSACYYEGPTSAFPRGRIVWRGTLGPDFGAQNAEAAVNEIAISFSVRVNSGVTQVSNTGVADSDRNGDGDFDDPGEQAVATASAGWSLPVSEVKELPQTGFAPGIVTHVPPQPAELRYTAPDGLALEIPAIGVNMPIVGVRQSGSGWDVTWLGQNAGWLNGTAYPTWKGNSVLTGHVWDALNKPGPFARVKTLKYGDEIRIHLAGQVYVYEVRETSLVNPRDTKGVFKHEEKAWLTLLTCEDYNDHLDSYDRRRIVRAMLVKVVPEE